MKHNGMAGLLACILLLFLTPIEAFKAEDFKLCSDSAFCTRLRGQTSQAFVIEPNSVVVSGSKFKATIKNKEDINGAFDLVLTAYNDNTIRLYINEPAEKGRYEVPDVLLPGLELREKSWEVVKKTGKKAVLRLGDSHTEATLTYTPTITLTVTVNNKPVLTWNNDNHFIFEHRREKQDDHPESWWEETFKGHSDSKKRGPESISFDVRLHGFEHVYGLPERAAPMSLRATVDSQDTQNLTEPYRLYNLDVFEYLEDSPFGLYGSIPLVIGHKVGQTVGVFWLNSAEMYVDVDKPGGSVGSQWVAESGVVDLFIMLGPTPKQVANQYMLLTGGTALPQMFSLGYHQCRWNYRDEEDVRDVDSGFDSHDIPYDVIWLDIEHTDAKKYFTWDSNYFPHPVEMQQNISSKGRKMVTIVDPHIKRESSWPLFKAAEDAGLYVKNKDGGDFDGWCWPGSSSYLDMTNPAVRSWWADRFSLSNYVGSTPDLYIWNDMNEPSVFNGPEITMPKDNLHFGGFEHRDVHNVYGYFYHMGTAEGLKRRGFQEKGVDGDRPFVLSRAFFSGTQRIGAIWTGDNGAQWPHLQASVPMLLSLGVSGLPFSGADIGGFFGNPDAELTTRWYQAGIYNPFFRGHAHLETARREPWVFGGETTERIREAIRQRYRLLPYIYTLFAHANATGAPIMRPLWWEFPEEEGIFAEDQIFMLGPSLLLAPVLHQGAEAVQVVLPGNDLWYPLVSGIRIDSSVTAHSRNFSLPVSMDSMPAYIRGGTMLPMKERARRSTAAMATDPITLIIALKKDGTASGDLYIDDGHSYAAFNRGQYTYRQLTYTADNVLKSTAGKREVLEGSGLPPADGSYNSNVLIDRIVVLGLPGKPEEWSAEVIVVGNDDGSNGSKSGSGVVVEVEAGPMYMKPKLPDIGVVVRRAQLSVSADWSVKFSRGGGSKTAAASTA